MLVEECIVQHEVLEHVRPGCVNSIRINTARDQKGQIHLIGACLKCGGAGAVADNFHSGGIAYPLDLDRGCVSGPGRNNTEIRDYDRHPGTDYYMPGLQIPHWEQIRALVNEAMERMPGIGYVGWDIAVTPDGCELIEGNCHWRQYYTVRWDWQISTDTKVFRGSSRGRWKRRKTYYWIIIL